MRHNQKNARKPSKHITSTKPRREMLFLDNDNKIIKDVLEGRLGQKYVE